MGDDEAVHVGSSRSRTEGAASSAAAAAQGPRAAASKRPRSERLPLGTFASGTSIYRNRLHAAERWEDGHVAIENLVLPETTSALCTTFVSPELDWLERDGGFLDSVGDLIVVRHDNRATGARNIGDAELTAMAPDRRPGWFWLDCKPHNGGLLHAKLLLFRSKAGLRIVVTGNNLYQEQWERDRDCLWVQDCYNTGATFSTGIQIFLKDLTACRDANDQLLVKRRLCSLFSNIDVSTVTARFVVSFPRPAKSTKNKGGWAMLSRAVAGLRRNMKSEDGGHDDDDDDDDDDKTRESPDSILHVMAGSFGNLKPDFLLQMKQAMSGNDSTVPKATDWDDVQGVRCLWPSRRTALSMNYMALVESMRPIPMNHWKTIPENAKRRIFFDAPPSPTEMWLPHLGCQPFSHAKVLIETGGSVGIVYVGSHNFSVAAWGMRGTQPKNVEAGMVIGTVSNAVQQEWLQRLPCALPNRNSQSPDNYIPASAHGGIRQAFMEGRPAEADRLFREWLNSNDLEVDHG